MTTPTATQQAQPLARCQAEAAFFGFNSGLPYPAGPLPVSVCGSALDAPRATAVLAYSDGSRLTFTMTRTLEGRQSVDAAWTAAPTTTHA